MYLSGSFRNHNFDLFREDIITFDIDKLISNYGTISYKNQFNFQTEYSRIETILEEMYHDLIQKTQDQIILTAINSFFPSSLIAELRYVICNLKNMDDRINLIVLENIQQFLLHHNTQEVRNYLKKLNTCVEFLQENITLLDKIDIEIVLSLLRTNKDFYFANWETEKRNKLGILPDDANDYDSYKILKMAEFAAPARIKDFIPLLSDTDKTKINLIASLYFLEPNNAKAISFLKANQEAIDKSEIIQIAEEKTLSRKLINSFRTKN